VWRERRKEGVHLCGNWQLNCRVCIMLLKSEKVRFAFRGWLMAKIFQTNIEKHLRQKHHSTTMTESGYSICQPGTLIINFRLRRLSLALLPNHSSNALCSLLSSPPHSIPQLSVAQATHLPDLKPQQKSTKSIFKIA